MATLLLFIIVFIYVSIIWVAVLVVYNTFIEPFDFGPLASFAWKSLLIVLIASLVVTFVPWGNFASLIVWWIGLMVLFKKDIWESKTLVILIWGINFLVGIGVEFLLRSIERSPISTV